MQTLKISGRCCIQISNMPGYTEHALTKKIGLGKGTGFSLADLLGPKPVETNYYVAVWTGHDNYTYAPVCKDTGNVNISVLIPDRHPDIMKVALLGRAFDEETKLTKNFYLVSGAMDLQKLTPDAVEEREISLSSPFDTNAVHMRYTCNPIDARRLTTSSLRYVNEWNQQNKALSESMLSAFSANRIQIPDQARGFAEGITFLPGGGGDFPHISAHDSVLSALVEKVDRKLPHVLLAYFLHLYFVHHGYTPHQLLEMSDADFTKEMFKIFSGPTRDAGFNPYQPDRTWDLANKAEGMMTSENIGNPIPASFANSPRRLI
jgi:hypothetical protein